jgi:Cu-Zn family superoxide dismutase
MRTEARFAPPTAFVPSAALTYDHGLVPPAAYVEVEQRGTRAGQSVVLTLRGLVPGRAYDAHVHRQPCGADPEASGGHYQHVPDPGHADAANEVWLDFTTDRAGNGHAVARKPWAFRAGEANSVVLHDPAGRRIGCVTVPFEPRA